MKFIQHRVNLESNLKLVPSKFGVEIDLRTSRGEIILTHDPNEAGELLKDWLDSFNHELLVLNVKEDGLESIILEFLEEHKIREYFFLDQPFPTLLKSLKSKINVAVRVSEFESINWTFEENPEWLWMDSFSGNWDYLNESFFDRNPITIKKCLVSPELHGRDPIVEIPKILNVLRRLKVMPDAVCTKNSDLWEKSINE